MIKQWIMKWAEKQRHKENGKHEKTTVVECLSPGGSSKLNSRYDNENVINFRVYGAHGGKIVETVRYNKATDRDSVNLYVIADDEDFNESLAKIITMDYMR